MTAHNLSEFFCMKAKAIPALLLWTFDTMVTIAWASRGSELSASEVNTPPSKRYLHVAVPEIRNYFGYGGRGILVFDMANDHRFVKRIKTQGVNNDGKPLNVKGVAVSVPLNSIYVRTLQTLERIDLSTEQIL